MAVDRFSRLTLGTGLTGTDLGNGELQIDATSSSSDPADDEWVWMPLVDSDGTCVLDDTGLIPTLIPLT